MSPAYLFQAPTGVEGDITRPDETSVEPAMLIAHTGTFAQKFGIPLKYATGGVQQFTGGETAPDFAGLLIREAPSIAGDLPSDAAFDGTKPNPDQPQGMAVRGYASVKCFAGTPTRGGVVYVQVTAHSGAAVGDFRADGTDSGNAVALTLTQASWATDGLDADKNAELRIAR